MNVSIVSQVNYSNAEVRGQLRSWKQKLARDYAAFESAFRRLGKGGDLGALLFDMVRCGRVGRQRAFEKINRALGPGANNNGNIETERGFFVKAGAGAFRCEMQGGPDKLNNGELSFFAFARTWIDDAQLHEDQIPLCEKGKPGERLGDSWFLPRPLRRIVEVATNQAQVIPLCDAVP